jgi:hypothetical protein
LKKLVAGFLLLAGLHTKAQMRFSVATDVGVMRNFSPDQKFWTFGQSVLANLHFSKKESAYAWINYYSKGRFDNDFTATAKSPATIPASFQYKVNGEWRINQFSIGWKHYLKGSFDQDYGWSMYNLVGFGLMFTRATNTFNTPVDTSQYIIPSAPVAGEGKFDRLTLDLGLGGEYSTGGNIFLYGELRTWLPTSNYPSPFLHNNKSVPLPVILSLGIRVMFGFDY